MLHPRARVLALGLLLITGCASRATEAGGGSPSGGMGTSEASVAETEDDETTAAAAPAKVFGPVKAGSWYPGERAELERLLDGMLAAAKPQAIDGQVRALISPHAGYAWSGPTAAHGYALLKGARYQRVVVLSPSHAAGFDGFSLLDADAYRTPLGDIPIDTEAAAQLRSQPDHRDVARAWPGEHAVEMQLPFLQRVLQPGFKLLPVIIGGASSDAQLRRLGAALKPLTGAQTLVVVSSDFTHYGENFGYFPFRDQVAQRLERELARPAIAAITRLDAAAFRAHLKKTGDTICGRDPIKALLYMEPEGEAELLALATSGEKGGDYSSSVTYVSLAFVAPAGETAPRAAPSELSAQEKRALIKIARASLSQKLRGGDDLDQLLAKMELTPGLKLERGAFVTINKKKRPGDEHAELRGCIGYLAPRGPLHQQIAELAISAGMHDTRFMPMKAAELDNVDLEISILSPMKPVAGYQEIEIGLHGMTLEKNGRRAVFLPQVAPEFGWDRATTLTRLSVKAGLPPDAWKQGTRFEVFTADVFHEHE